MNENPNLHTSLRNPRTRDLRQTVHREKVQIGTPQGDTGFPTDQNGNGGTPLKFFLGGGRGVILNLQVSVKQPVISKGKIKTQNKSTLRSQNIVIYMPF